MTYSSDWAGLGLEKFVAKCGYCKSSDPIGQLATLHWLMLYFFSHFSFGFLREFGILRKFMGRVETLKHCHPIIIFICVDTRPSRAVGHCLHETVFAGIANGLGNPAQSFIGHTAKGGFGLRTTGRKRGCSMRGSLVTCFRPLRSGLSARDPPAQRSSC